MAEAGGAPLELGTSRIGKLLKQYAVPSIIASTASSLYNMVDSIFIGHMPGEGSLSLSGLAVSFPLMNLSTALGTLVGVGAATMVSVYLGQKNYKAASMALANVLSLNTIISLLFMAVMLLFLDPVLMFFGASQNTLPYARDYMTIILLGNVELFAGNPAVGAANLLGMGHSEGVVGRTYLHDDGHLAVLIEVLQGIGCGDEASVDTFVCHLESPDVLQALDGYRRAVVPLLVEVYRLHNAAVDEVHEACANGEEQYFKDNLDCFVHCILILFLPNPQILTKLLI